MSRRYRWPDHRLQRLLAVVRFGLTVAPGHHHHPVPGVNQRVRRRGQPDLPAGTLRFQDTQHNNGGSPGCQLLKGQPCQRLATADIELIATFSRQQLVVDLGQSRMDDVLDHQPADCGITGHHLHRARVGPLHHRQFADILQLGHHKRQPGAIMPGLGRNG